MQREGPVAYFSRKFQGAEQNYSIIEKELLAIIRILEEYWGILLGQQIRVYTDHSNLQYSEFSSQRVLCHRLQIEEFAPEIVYIKGTDNVVADTLSRLQRNPEIVVLVEDRLQCPVAYQTICKHQKDMLPIEGEICQKFGGIDLRTFKNRIIIPDTLQHEVIHLYHEWLCHPGLVKLYNSLKSCYFWRGMFIHIRTYTKNCQECVETKVSNRNFGKLPLAKPEIIPFNTVCIDVIGPYNLPERGEEKYALTILDPVSRWLEIVPLRSKSSIEISEAFDTQWLCCYPRPSRCVHDQGKEFTG